MPSGDIDRRELARVVRRAALSAYGVATVSGTAWYHAIAGRLGLESGVDVATGPPLRVRANVHLAPGVPAATVAANVVEAVRYNVQRDLGRHIDELSVTVDGLPVVPIEGGRQAGPGDAR